MGGSHSELLETFGLWEKRGVTVKDFSKGMRRRLSIAMASHGRTGLSRVCYGSVAAGVLHRIDRPLLLIRSREAR